MARCEWFVGREQARTVLSAALEAARSGAGGLVLLSSEPGIGRSALPAWAGASETRRSRVARILLGQRERAAVLAVDPGAPRLRDPAADLGAAGLLLAPFDADDPVGSRDLLAGSDAKFRLLDAVTDALRTLARTGPILIAVDDVHWADDASLELLSFQGMTAMIGLHAPAATC